MSNPVNVDFVTKVVEVEVNDTQKESLAAAAAIASAGKAAEKASAAASSASTADAVATALTDIYNEAISSGQIVAPAIDPILTISGAAADAQVTGDYIGDIQSRSIIVEPEVGFSVSYQNSALRKGGWVVTNETITSSVSSAIEVAGDYVIAPYTYNAEDIYATSAAIGFYSSASVGNIVSYVENSYAGQIVIIPTGATHVRFTIPEDSETLSVRFANSKLTSDKTLSVPEMFADAKVTGDYLFPAVDKVDEIYSFTSTEVSGEQVVISDASHGKVVSITGVSSGATIYNEGKNRISSATYYSQSTRYSYLSKITATGLVVGKTYTISVKIAATGNTRVSFDGACGLYNTFPIDVIQGEQVISYTFVANATSCTNKTALSLTGTTNETVTPSEIMIEEGESAGDYEPYRSTDTYLDGSDVVLYSSTNIIYTSNDDDITIVYNRLFADAIRDLVTNEVDEAISDGKGYYTIKGNLTTGQSFSIPKTNLKNNQNYTFMCKVTSLTELLIGHGKTQYDSSYIKITQTNADFTDYTGSASTVQHAHGLTIADFLYVNIQVKEAKNATITIQTKDDGNGTYEYSYNVTSWLGDSNADYFVECVNGTLTECTFTWGSGDFHKKIWAFGDSYFSVLASRWPYYMQANGFYDVPLWNAFPGENSSQAIESLQNMILNYGKPKMILWAMGMNDASDTGTTPSESWLSNIQQFLGICEEYNIEPVLCTIPTVSNEGNLKNNEGKCAWVRNSGYRYVDCALAVGSQPDGTWYPNMLSSDEEHPDVEGGKALYKRFIMDCPELTFKN